MTMQKTLNKYFTESWKPDYSKFKYSGFEILKHIRNNDSVLDVGCGYNLFKPYLGHRLIGIDPAMVEGPDQHCTIEEFKGGQFDVVLCLGSINFGGRVRIEKQITKVVSHVKPGGLIFWRQNPGIGDHPWKGVEEIKFFPWTIGLNYYYAYENGCQVLEAHEDTGNRIYSVWAKRI